jgi:hypothetical protein
LLRGEAVPMPQPCHIVRSTTVNDGSPQSRCAVHLGCRYGRRDVGEHAADHGRPYKADVGGLRTGGAVELSLLHQGTRLRSAPRGGLPGSARGCAPAFGPRCPGCVDARPLWIGPVVMSRSPDTFAAQGQGHASGGGSAGTGWEGAPFPTAGTSWRAWGAPIPSTVDPGRAEQTRPMASRSFVQLGAPPVRHEPRPLHGVWGDGRRDGSWGEWWVGVGKEVPDGKLPHNLPTWQKRKGPPWKTAGPRPP